MVRLPSKMAVMRPEAIRRGEPFRARLRRNRDPGTRRTRGIFPFRARCAPASAAGRPPEGPSRAIPRLRAGPRRRTRPPRGRRGPRRQATSRRCRIAAARPSRAKGRLPRTRPAWPSARPFRASSWRASRHRRPGCSPSVSGSTAWSARAPPRGRIPRPRSRMRADGGCRPGSRGRSGGSGTARFSFFSAWCLSLRCFSKLVV